MGMEETLSVLMVRGRSVSGSWLVPVVKTLAGLGWSQAWVLCTGVPAVCPGINGTWGHLLLICIMSAISFHFKVLTLCGFFVQTPRFCWITGALRTSLVPSGISRKF